MISNEPLKKVRQIEIRVNCLGTESLSDFSFQSSLHAFRISRGAKDSDHADEFRLDSKKDAIFLEDFDRSSPSRFAPKRNLSGFSKMRRMVAAISASNLSPSPGF